MCSFKNMHYFWSSEQEWAPKHYQIEFAVVERLISELFWLWHTCSSFHTSSVPPQFLPQATWPVIRRCFFARHKRQVSLCDLLWQPLFFGRTFWKHAANLLGTATLRLPHIPDNFWFSSFKIERNRQRTVRETSIIRGGLERLIYLSKCFHLAEAPTTDN